MQDNEKERIKTGLFVALYFVALLWLVKIIETAFDLTFLYEYGILPRDYKGLTGIITAPFIHSGYMHLFNNSVPLFIAIAGIIYFYPRAAIRVLLFTYLLTNILVWLFAHPGYHIGASGLVYAYISFLFFGSAFSHNKNMLVISLLILFIYGAMFWGIFPQKGQISWESHLFGSVSGFLFAFIFRNYAEAKPEPEMDDDEDDEMNNDALSESQDNHDLMGYTMAPDDKKEE
jgi:membrane associated rhomboid family serine protease